MSKFILALLYTMSSSPSATPSLLLLAAFAGGVYLLLRPSTSATSTTGIFANNFSKGAGATLQQRAWALSDGSDADYAKKMKQVYDDEFGEGRW